MKTRKRLLALFLSAMLLLSACGGSPAGGETAPEGGGASAPGGSQTEGEGAGSGSELSPAMQAVVDSVTAENAQAAGVCGPDIVWYFKDGVLVLEGTGPMTDYGDFDSPAWFDFADEISMIYVPEGVTTVGRRAFTNTAQLSRVVLPSTLESIGEYAFHMSGLTGITIPDSVTEIRDSAFSNCEELKEISIPNSVTKISNGMFCSCSQLQTVDIPNSVTGIDERAFEYCSALKELTIPASVTTLGGKIYDSGRLIFLGDAPAPMYEDDVNFYDRFFNYEFDEVTVVYYGEGFEPYIEAAEGHPNIQWVKG